MGQLALHSSPLVSRGYLCEYCILCDWSGRCYGGNPGIGAESMEASAYRGNLRTSGKYGSSRDGHEGPTASSWRSLWAAMGLGSDARDATVDSGNIGNCVDGFE